MIRTAPKVYPTALKARTLGGMSEVIEKRLRKERPCGGPEVDPIPDSLQLLCIRTQEFNGMVAGLVDPEAKEHMPGQSARKLKKMDFNLCPIAPKRHFAL